MDCMNKLKSNKVRGQPLGTPPRMLVLTQPSVGGCLHHSLGHTARGWGTPLGGGALPGCCAQLA